MSAELTLVQAGAPNLRVRQAESAVAVRAPIAPPPPRQTAASETAPQAAPQQDASRATPPTALPAVLSGCEAVARGAWEGGAQALVSYPGSPVTGVVDAAKGYAEIACRWAANEKVALEIAAGIAYSGAAALVVMKHVGVNVAADALFNLAYTGVRGGLVVVVGDDPGASCSQNEQDTRLVAVAAQLPVLEPADANEALLFTRLAFAISHEFDLPVIVRLTTQLCYATQPVVSGARQERPMDGGFAGPTQKYLLLPSHVPARRRALLASLERFAGSAWATFFYQEMWPAKTPAADQQGRLRYPVGLICAGHTAAQCREHFQGELPILQVGCAWPLNAERVAQFAERCERLVVTEECSNHLRDQVRALGHSTIELGRDAVVGEFRVNRLRQAKVSALDVLLDRADPLSPASSRRRPVLVPVVAEHTLLGLTDLPSAPARPPGFCAGCSHVGAFDALRTLGRHVVGDIGCYTLGAGPAFGALHSNLCMGASIGVLQGYLTLQPQRRREVIAVIGDSTFFHSGMPSLMTAVNNGVRGTLLVLDNSGTAMTGFQRTAPNLDADGWDALLRGLGVQHRAVVEALDVAAIETQLAVFDHTDGMAVIVFKGLCVQGRPRKGPTNFRYTVNESACTGCGTCKVRTDCPALVPAEAGTDGSPTALKMSITDACIGCGMCSQTCPEQAILPMTVKTGIGAADKLLGKVPWHRAIRFVQKHDTLNRIAQRFERELD